MLTLVFNMNVGIVKSMGVLGIGGGWPKSPVHFSRFCESKLLAMSTIMM